MKTKITLLIAFIITLGNLNAQDFTIDGVNYTITDVNNLTVEVSASSCYNGDLNLSNSIENNGVTYSVTSIEQYAFVSCSTLASVTIPNSITIINEGVFLDSSITGITLPNTITSINSRVFERCANLTSINLSSLTSLTNIGERAFEQCINLADVNFPASLTSIGKEAFIDCKSFTTISIPESVTIINESVFAGCENINTVNLPNTLSVIGEGAFAGLINLTEIDFPNTGSLTTIGERAFNYTGLTEVQIPNSVTILDDRSFSECESLISVTLPEGILSIGNQVFRDCVSLTNIIIPNSVKNLGASTFRGCTSLENITLPTSLTTIETSLFEECTSLQSIDLLNTNITYIGFSAFEKSGIRSITIPDSVTEIENSAFRDCTDLVNATLSENINIINNHLFRNCTSLKEINIPNKVVTIRDYAFRECSGLESVNLPNSLKQIDVQAFQQCFSLSKINIPESVEVIQYAAFSNLTGLNEVTVNWNTPFVTTTDIFVATDISNAILRVPVNTKTLYEIADTWQDFGAITENGPTNNLVINGSAEITPILNNGWTQVSGNWATRNASPEAQDGDNYFFAGTSTSAELYQDVDVSSFSSEIDAGSQNFYFSVYLRSYGQSPSDNSQAIVEYRDAAGTVLSTYDTNISQTSASWVLYEDTRIAPIGTKTIRVKLFAYRNAGSNNDGYIDNVVLEKAAPAIVSIPDANFEQHLLEIGIDKDGTLNGQVLKQDIINVFSLNISEKNISDLTGIQDFRALKFLIAKDNYIINLDISKNVFLETLDLNGNELTEIDISKNIKLKSLNVSSNQLTSLDISDNVNLEGLTSANNNISTIDFTNNSKLDYITLSGNKFQTIDISMLAALKTLYIGSNELTLLDVSKNSKLSILHCSNNQITNLNIESNLLLHELYTSNNLITRLDASKNKWLTKLFIPNNKLVSLNTKNETDSDFNTNNFSAKGNPDLYCIQVDDEAYSEENWREKVDAQVVFSTDCPEYTTIPDTNFEAYLESINLGNGIVGDNLVNKKLIKLETGLDISNKNIADLTGIQDFAALTTLNATNNTVSAIDVSENILLETLLISQNQLTEIDLSNNVNLKNVNLGNNQFTTLSLSENSNLESLNFDTNSISTIDFSANIKLKNLYIGNNLLEDLDVSMLSDLTILWCFNNELTSLNTSNNLKLESLDCGSNQLSTLNVDDNIALNTMICNFNQLTTLNLSLNTNLTSLNCEQNSIFYLDMSANELLTSITCNDNALVGLNMQNGNNNQILNENFSAFANPNLICVQVDENYSQNWAQIDMQTEFNSQCPELIFIPDTNFEAFLESLNVGNGIVGDFYVKKDLIEVLTTLNIEAKSISDLTGIENFTSLKELIARNNNLTQVNLSSNLLLEELDLSTNQLTTIDVSKNVKLKNINFSNNLLTEINVDALLDLEGLVFNENKVSTINLENNTKLKALYCFLNKIQTLDISKNASLNFIDIDDNELSYINFKNGNNTALAIFSALGNLNLTCVEVNDVTHFTSSNMSLSVDSQTKFYENCPSQTAITDANFETYLESINVGNGVVGDGLVITEAIEIIKNLNIEAKNITDLTGIQDFTNLEKLNANNNKIAQVDLSKNTSLEELLITNNQLSLLDLSNNLSLKNLDVGENNLTFLEVNQLAELESLSVYKNQLTKINLISNKELLAFVANENQLKYVDIRENTNLIWLDLDDNLLEDLMLKNNNNTQITQFSITGNPNLTCIEVDAVNFSNTNWTNKDATANYSIDCAPANDDCAKAIPLTFGQLTPGDVNSGNANDNPSCAVGNVITDVWYTVVVPNTGEFSVEGSSLEGTPKFAVYQTCTSLAAIACGTSISLKNLTVGTTFYLRVWVENNAAKSNNNQSNTGLFTLTASESSVLSVNDFTKEKNQLLVYPNPAKSKVSIELLNGLAIEKVEVFSVLGDKVITQKSKNKSIISVDISNLSAGIYFIKANSEKEILSKKLIIN